VTDLASPRVLAAADPDRRPLFILGALVLAVLAAFVPTALMLAAGPWQTEQEGHGPFILAIATWVVWSKRGELRQAVFRPAPVSGWIALIGGLLLMILGRSQEILAIEVTSLMPILIGVILMIGGWPVLRTLAFPIGIVLFAVPPPGWLLDALTLPLKASISDAVTRLLYVFGYPVAQNGVVIMVGPYQLLVKDACAGMNSIFALSAIGIVYLYMVQHPSRLRNILLFLSILPITIMANFLRVLALVLIAYHYGSAAIEGAIHEFTGLALFVVAFAIMLVVDGALGLLFALGNRIGQRNSPVAKPIQPVAAGE
jgi:exosortase B